jgi:hypothetical protein
MTLKIYGHSDDVVCLEGRKDFELYNDIDGRLQLMIGNPNPEQNKDSSGVMVTMTYGAEDKAVWSATVFQLDEDIECPWSVSLTFKGYSPTVTIDCPDDTPVFYRNKRTGKWRNVIEKENE